MLLSFPLACAADAADAGRNPMAILGALADRIYVVGETSGNAEDMISAEAKAAEEVRRYVASGATEGLLALAPGKPSPLATAATMGYPNVVTALLTSPLVRAHIDDAAETGVTPWIAANFSMEQSAWTCSPSVFDDPFKFIARLVAQPYYLSNPIPPYRKTRELLEQAGARADMAQAKTVWLALCRNRSAATAARIEAAADLQDTVQALGLEDLTEHLLQLQKKAATSARTSSGKN